VSGGRATGRVCFLVRESQTQGIFDPVWHRIMRSEHAPVRDALRRRMSRVYAGVRSTTRMPGAA